MVAIVVYAYDAKVRLSIDCAIDRRFVGPNGVHDVGELGGKTFARFRCCTVEHKPRCLSGRKNAAQKVQGR